MSFGSTDFGHVNISIEYSNGEVGPVVLKTDECFSWGVQSNKKKFANGDRYTLPIVMLNRQSDGKYKPTEHQKEFLKVFNKIVEKCKSHLESLELDFPENIAKCMYTKGSCPTLYAKLYHKNKNDEITTPFYDMEKDDEVNPKKFIDERSQVKAAIRFDNIYIGNTISLQTKVVEAKICKSKPMKKQRQRLF